MGGTFNMDEIDIYEQAYLIEIHSHFNKLKADQKKAELQKVRSKK